MSPIAAGLCVRGAVDPPAGIAEAVLLAGAAGFDSVMAASIFDLSATLDPAELDAIRAAAATQGVQVTVGLPYLHPDRLHLDRDLLAAGDGDAMAGLIRALGAARAFASDDIPFVLGYVEDRMSDVVPWRAQLDATAELFRGLRPVLLDLDLRLCIKTHEEITTFEIVELIDRVGADVLSIGLDPVNVPLRMEDPVAAAQRCAPYVRHVYFDDATFTAEGVGYRRWLCPAGEGVIDWPMIRGIVAAASPEARYWVDLHKGQFTIEPHDAAWLRWQPDLTEAERAAVVALAEDGGRRLGPAARASLPRVQAERRSRLPRAIDRLTDLVGPR